MTERQTFTPFIAKIQAVLFVFVCSTNAFATELPEALKYQGNPIDPLCFKDTMTSGPEPDLKVCSDPKLKESIEILPEKNRNNDSIGYMYKKVPFEDRYAYVYYRYIGSHEGREVILVNVSGGGTGQFSFVLGMKRKGDKLIEDKDYAGGDRCNGGINEVVIKNGKVIITENVTPSDLYELAEVQPPNGLKAYEVLDGTPHACLGQSQTEDGRFVAYMPTKELYFSKTHIDSKTREESYNDCFMGLYKDVPFQETWSPAQIKELMNRFNQTCFQNK
jgi:hypothetical protein